MLVITYVGHISNSHFKSEGVKFRLIYPINFNSEHQWNYNMLGIL